MTSSLARLGSFETRLATQTIWSSGKRKRTNWVCAECKARRASRQRRAFGDDSLKISPSHYLFPPRGSHTEENNQDTPSRSASWATQQAQWRPWGLGRKDDGPETRQNVGAQEDAAVSEDGMQNTLWEKVETIEEDIEPKPLENLVTYEAVGAQEIARDATLLNLDYVSVLPQALLDNDSDMVARCLYAAQRSNDLDFIRSMPRNTFVECIRILQPSNFILPLATAHVEMSEAVARQLGFSNIQQVAWHHSKVLLDVLGMRRSAGAKVGLTEYRMLLRSAHDLKDNAAARRIWHYLMSDGLTPDTACYNSMMSANIWNGMLQSAPRHKTRVISFFQLARQASQPAMAFANYRVGKGGLKEQVSHVFSDMLKNGAVADEESFCNVIMAAGREGDLAMVNSILRKVWDIDVDALSAGKEEPPVKGKITDPNSSLRPTTRLLFTIAHTFGVNNDVPNALRLVDFVTRRYDIAVDTATWKQLFEWTFVLAIQRHGVRSHTDGSKTGELPLRSVLNLWETMIGPPYFVKPTMGMYNQLIKNLQLRESPAIMYDKMCEGRRLYVKSSNRAYRAFARLKRAVEAEDQAPSISLETLRRKWEHQDLIRKRDLFWCKRWLRLLLSTLPSFNRVDEKQDWALREIPRSLWGWRELAPTLVRYETPSGVVEFEIRTAEQIALKKRRSEEKQKERRNTLAKVPFYASEEWVRPRLPTR